MCLAIPGRVVEVYDSEWMRMARVDFGGVQKEVSLAYVPDAEVGDYAIVHVGFAIQKLDEASALRTLALFQELGALEDELGPAA
jgi:hydrogenase expression/formation protein HypC